MSLNSHYNDLYKDQKPFGDTIHPFVEEVFSFLHSGSVLDIGAGQGRNSLPFARRGFRVSAIDISSEAMRQIKEASEKESLNIEIATGDVGDIVLRKQYDLIICSFMLHHLGPRDGIALMERIKKHTNPKGFNIIMTFTTEGDFFRLNGPSRFYVKRGQLEEIYSDWKILQYKEKTGRAFQKNESGQNMQNLAAYLFAQKS